MTTRLVLECGSVGRGLVKAVRSRREWLLVLTADPHRVETLRDDGIDAKRADVTDPAAIRAHAAAVDTVVVAGDDAGQNSHAATAAREVFPDAFVLAYAGDDPTPAEERTLEDAADRVVDPRRVTADVILERVGEDGARTRQLSRVLRTLDEPLAIVTHDNPDPDAIASAVALRRIAASAGCESEVCYFGEISHQENRALVNLLEFDLRQLGPEDSLSYGSYALVDHSRPGVNDQLHPETPVDIVIDHHPPRAAVKGEFVDLRSGVGATSTLLVDYLRQLNLEPEPAVATSLLFGIFVDTDDFTREVSPEDFRAAAYLFPHSDVGTLERIESPRVSADTLESLARAIVNRNVEEGVLTTSVDRVTDRDVLAQAADRLLDLEGVNTALVFGYTGTEPDDTVYVSARARGTDVDLGEVLRDAFGQIGSAGGHADMAGAQIPVRSLASGFGTGEVIEEGEERETATRGGERPDESESTTPPHDSTSAAPEFVIREVVTDRFFETLRGGRKRVARPLHGSDSVAGTMLEGFDRPDGVTEGATEPDGSERLEGPEGEDGPERLEGEDGPEKLEGGDGPERLEGPEGEDDRDGSDGS